MAQRTVPTELTNFVVLEDTTTGKLLVMLKHSKRHGDFYTFPGGHADQHEPMTQAAARELQEETGLTVHAPQLMGFINYHNLKLEAREFIFLYKGTQYTGDLLPATEEGEFFWMTQAELEELPIDAVMQATLEALRSAFPKEYVIEEDW
jgi:8-oxo-dGTP diphosphatase